MRRPFAVFQDALKSPRATESEATQLYFLLGNVFYNTAIATSPSTTWNEFPSEIRLSVMCSADWLR